MTKISKSPDRFTFQLNNYITRMKQSGRTPENDDHIMAMVHYIKNSQLEKESLESSEEWKEDNLEYDLRTNDWILEKVRNSDVYAQNLYAALCNNDFIKRHSYNILKNMTWSCSWRHAGGIIADMKQKGDYIDWYCSGKFDQEEDTNLVPEGEVTAEIREDLKTLGWNVIESDENE